MRSCLSAPAKPERPRENSGAFWVEPVRGDHSIPNQQLRRLLDRGGGSVAVVMRRVASVLCTGAWPGPKKP
jgi:hypothetical protein